MLIVEGFSGERYSAKTAAQIVAKMQRDTWGGYKAAGVKGYMRQVAKRVLDWCGKKVRTERSAEFLADLVKAGFIRLISGKSASEKED